MSLFGAKNPVAQNVQAPDSNTYEIGGSRFGLFDGYLMNGAYGQGGTSTPAAYATPSIPPIYPNISPSGSYGPSSNSMAMAQANPFNPKHSPLVLVVAGGILAVVVLHWLHWREREEKKEGE